MAIETDLRASFDYWRAGELSILGYLKSLAKTRMVVEFAPNDWGPFWYAVRAIGSSAIDAFRNAGRRRFSHGKTAPSFDLPQDDC